MHNPPTWGLIYWPLYIVAAIALFAGPELVALFTHSSNTLSYFAWWELGIGGRYNPHTVFWWVSLLGFIAITATLIGHIWFRTPA
jgi:hypothetical protein